MIITLLLTLVFVFMASYNVVFIKNSAVRVVLVATYALAIFFVWSPATSTAIANFFGIGRGLDFFLILLSVTIVNAMVVIARHLHSQHQSITKLARYIALRDAVTPKVVNVISR